MLETNVSKVDTTNPGFLQNSSSRNLRAESSYMGSPYLNGQAPKASQKVQDKFPEFKTFTERSSLTNLTKGLSTYNFQQSYTSKPVQYSLMKIENQSLKVQNGSLKETVGKLRKQLEQKVSTLKKFNELMKIKYEELKTLKATLQQKQNLISSLQNQKSGHISIEQATRLKELVIRKSKQLDDINEKIHNLEHQNFKNQLFQMKITNIQDQLQQQRAKTHSYLLQNSVLSQKITELQEKICVLEFQNQKDQVLSKVAEVEQIQSLFKSPESSPSKNQKQSTHLTAFQEALKVQMKQIEQLKRVIQNSTELVQKLKQNLVNSRRELEQLRAEMKIQALKTTSQRKKLIMEYRLQLHEKDNEINTSFKRYKTLEEKYKNALVEIKAKDEFFRQHLVGRTNEASIQEYIESTLRQFTQNFEDILVLKTQNGSLKQKLKKYQKYEEQVNFS